MKKSLAISIVFMMMFVGVQSSFAGGREGFSSLILPGTGQVMNGQGSDMKTKIFGAVEVGAIATTAILGAAVGGPIIWAGLGPLIGNHVIAAADAAFTPSPSAQQQQNFQQPYLYNQQPFQTNTFQQSNQFPENNGQNYGRSSYVPTRSY
jgi:hypothetical protein